MNPFEECLKVRKEGVEEGLGTPSSSSSSLIQVSSPISSPLTSPQRTDSRRRQPFRLLLHSTRRLFLLLHPKHNRHHRHCLLNASLRLSRDGFRILLYSTLLASDKGTITPTNCYSHTQASPAPPDNSISFPLVHRLRIQARLLPLPTTTTTATSQGVPTIPVTPPVLPTPFLQPTPFPQPWDESGLGLNFSTQGCLDFFQNMTNTAPFRSCRPFSVLSLWSSSFTAPQSNISLLNDILRGTCNPLLDGGLDQFTQNMRWFEREMVKDDVCGKETNEMSDLVVKTRGVFTDWDLLLFVSNLALSTCSSVAFRLRVCLSAMAPRTVYRLNDP
ncbi:hypothetical protein VKT23_011919 [Stygiomarasmius scandens]|uniref:DUF7729 domain-containing protein n=1 Tax=Marasmiellus scandens TaxID=2682957 RepID=A0ABR1JBY7_9AGAR